jgi:hypothetical protein
MERLNPARAVWTLQRAYLRHGPGLLAAALGLVAVAVVASMLVTSAVRLKRLGDALAQARTAGAVPAPAPRPLAADTPQVLPLPGAARRFEITGKVLETLEKSGFEPEQIRFRFEHADDAGVTRQVAVFAVATRWDEIARLLARLEAVDRAVYIARLHVTRDSAGDPRVTAEIQLAVALRDEAAAGAAP